MAPSATSTALPTPPYTTSPDLSPHDGASPRPPSARRLSPHPILDRPHLERTLLAAGLRVSEAHLESFYGYLHVRGYESAWEDVVADLTAPKSAPGRRRPSLPRAFLRHLLRREENGGGRAFASLSLGLSSATTSAAGDTTKLVLATADGHAIEAVMMRHAGGRNTACVSSQVGCAMGCTFCATGTMGLRGSLNTGEILEQLVWLERTTGEKVRNVVFMGMGEPLDNYDAVVAACRSMINRHSFALGHGKVTVSTVGIVHAMRRFTADCPQVNLALSLHAPNEEMRRKIVPTAKRFELRRMVEALEGHSQVAEAQQGRGMGMSRRRRRAMIEYIMLTGPTSSFACAHQLGQLVENKKIMVNLIPYNSTDVRDTLSCPPIEDMLNFRDIVATYGVLCTIRRTMGADIAGACGQLVKAKERKQRQRQSQQQQGVEKTLQAIVDIEDGPMLRPLTKAPVTILLQERVSHTSKDSGSRESEGGGEDEGEDKGNDATTTETKKVQELSWKKMVRRETRPHQQDLDAWVLPLSMATACSATVFLATSVMLLRAALLRRR